MCDVTGRARRSGVDEAQEEREKEEADEAVHVLRDGERLSGTKRKMGRLAGKRIQLG